MPTYLVTSDGDYIETTTSGDYLVVPDLSYTAAEVAEAIREVLIANTYRPSRAVESFDTSAAGGLHKQFYMEGPRLAEPANPARYRSPHKWELIVWIAFVPRVGGDPDMGRFEVVAALDDLIEAWAENTAIQSDEFSVVSAEPRYDAEHAFWALRVELGYTNERRFT